MSMKDKNFSLKVVMNKQQTKVLFAEAKSDFTNVLLSFLTLPLGKIVKLLQEQYGADDEVPPVGSLTTLYNGLANLDAADFSEEVVKQMLLDPRRSCTPTKFFCCEDLKCRCSKKVNISLYRGIATCACGKPITREVRSTSRDELMSESSLSDDDDDDDDVGGVFAASGVNFIVSDDLLILPNDIGYVIQILGITDADIGAMKNVTFGYKEIMDLLKGCFLSRAPLTDVILNKGQFYSTRPSETKIVLEKNGSSPNSNKMTLKATVRKSTNKILFAQAEKEFIDVLFSLLTIPLGGVERLLEGKSSLRNTVNLYESVVKHLDERYFESECAISSLIAPKLPYGRYMLVNQILPLEEEKACKMYHYGVPGSPYDNIVVHPCFRVTSFRFPKREYSYVKGPSLYTVMDDLSVAPSSMTSCLSYLLEQKIPLSDVTEMELHIGLPEVLSILKASLVSKSALSSGLRHFLLKRRPKQEHCGFSVKRPKQEQ